MCSRGAFSEEGRELEGLYISRGRLFFWRRKIDVWLGLEQEVRWLDEIEGIYFAALI